MRKQYLRWILPILAVLLIATFLVLSPLLTIHAATRIAPVATPAITMPTLHGAKPDMMWQH